MEHLTANMENTNGLYKEKDTIWKQAEENSSYEVYYLID